MMLLVLCIMLLFFRQRMKSYWRHYRPMNTGRTKIPMLTIWLRFRTPSETCLSAKSF
jgi:hypothetical protein